MSQLTFFPPLRFSHRRFKSVGRYRCILADAPWRFDQFGMQKHGAVRAHYKTLEVAELARFGVEDLAHPDACALFLWVCSPKLQEGLDVMDAWGFRYVTKAFSWVKTYKPNEDGEANRYCGLGNYTRSGTEDVLLGIRGKGMTKLRLSRNVRQVIEAPVDGHSRKPDEIYERIEALFPGPYAELFARRARPGWDAFGNERGVKYALSLEPEKKKGRKK